MLVSNCVSILCWFYESCLSMNVTRWWIVVGSFLNRKQIRFFFQFTFRYKFLIEFLIVKYNMTSERQTLTPLMQLVCCQAAYIRPCYAGSSWDIDKKTPTSKNVSVHSMNREKHTFGLNNQVKKNAHDWSILTEDEASARIFFYFYNIYLNQLLLFYLFHIERNSVNNKQSSCTKPMRW